MREISSLLAVKLDANALFRALALVLMADKKELRKECKEFRKANTELNEKVLNITNDLHDKILNISNANERLKRDVRFYRDTKWSRDIGAGVLAVCGVTAPLFNFNTLYWCIVFFAIASYILGTWFSRLKHG